MEQELNEEMRRQKRHPMQEVLIQLKARPLDLLQHGPLNHPTTQQLTHQQVRQCHQMQVLLGQPTQDVLD